MARTVHDVNVARPDRARGLRVGTSGVDTGVTPVQKDRPVAPQAADEATSTTVTAPASAVTDPARLAALRRSNLLDAPPDKALDRATRLASRLLGAPVSLVSLVEPHRQHFASQVGLPSPWSEIRETPLTHSFCQYVVLDDDVLAIGNSRTDARVGGNGAVADLGVIAYLGVPLRDRQGYTLGSFCVIDDQPRTWTEEDIALLRDIADQVEVELALRDALQRTHDLLLHQQNAQAMLAHDLRAPLTAIIGSFELIDHPQATDAIRAEMLAMSQRQARTMQAMVTGLLDAEASRHDPVQSDTDLSEVVRSIQQARSLAGAGHRLVVDVPGSLVVRTGPAQVEQVIGNLVDNALRHAGDDATVTISIPTPTADEAQIVVADDGVGMDPDALASLMHPFQRGEGATGDGVGLGLHIVQTLVDALGGHLDVSSAPGRGARFTVTLPLHGDDRS